MPHENDTDDLDALSSSTPPVDSWGETDAADSHLDLVALTSSTSSAPPRIDGVGRWRLLGLVAGVGIGFGLASLVFGASAEVALAARASVPLAAPRTEASVPPTAPPPTAASARVLETPARREISSSPRRAPAAPRALLPPAPVVPRSSEPVAVEPRLDPTPAVSASAVVSSERDISTLLDGAIFPTARREESVPPPENVHPEVLPLMPSRAEVEGVLTALRPVMRGCAMGQSGLATADIVVRSDGTVAGVRVAGAPFAGAASGRCMEGVVRPARFPRFTKPTFHVRFPFAIP